jgi:hypothetical protein
MSEANLDSVREEGEQPSRSWASRRSGQGRRENAMSFDRTERSQDRSTKQVENQERGCRLVEVGWMQKSVGRIAVSNGSRQRSRP